MVLLPQQTAAKQRKSNLPPPKNRNCISTYSYSPKKKRGKNVHRGFAYPLQILPGNQPGLHTGISGFVGREKRNRYYRDRGFYPSRMSSKRNTGWRERPLVSPASLSPGKSAPSIKKGIGLERCTAFSSCLIWKRRTRWQGGWN